MEGTKRAPRMLRVLMMKRVLGAMTTMASTWAAGQLKLGIVGMQRGAMFRVGVWAPSVRHPGEHLGPHGRGMGPRGPPGVLCHPATQPVSFGAAFSCSRCAVDDGSLQVLVRLLRLKAVSRGQCLLSLLPFSRCTNAVLRTMNCWCCRGATTLEDRVTSAAGPVPKDARSQKAQQLGQSDAPKFSSEYPFLPFPVTSLTHRPLDQWFRPATSVR